MAQTNAERQRRFRERRKARNATVTPEIAEETVTVPRDGTMYKNGHQYYTNAKGEPWILCCCDDLKCRYCRFQSDTPDRERPTNRDRD